MTVALRRTAPAVLAVSVMLGAACGVIGGDDGGFAGCGSDTDELAVAHAALASEVSGAQGVAGGDGHFWLVTGEDQVLELDADTGVELQAFDADDLAWEADPTSWISPGAAGYFDSTLYIGDQNVVAIDRSAGDELAARQIEFGATFSDVNVFAGFGVGAEALAAIDINSGSVRYVPIEDGVAGGGFVEIPSSGNAVDVAVLDDVVFWTDGTGRLRQFDLITQQTATAAHLGDVSALAAARDHLVVVIADGQRIASFEPSTGALVTAGFGLGSGLRSPQMASDGCSVWVTSQSSLFLADDPATEVCLDGCLLRLEPETGDVMAVVELDGGAGGPGLAVADGRVLVLGELRDDPGPDRAGIDAPSFSATYADDSLVGS